MDTTIDEGKFLASLGFLKSIRSVDFQNKSKLTELIGQPTFIYAALVVGYDETDFLDQVVELTGEYKLVKLDRNQRFIYYEHETGTRFYIHYAFTAEELEWQYDYVAFYYTPVLGKILKRNNLLLSKPDGLLYNPGRDTQWGHEDIKFFLSLNLRDVFTLIGLNMDDIDFLNSTKEEKMDFILSSECAQLNKLAECKETDAKAIQEIAQYIQDKQIPPRPYKGIKMETVENYFGLTNLAGQMTEIVEQRKVARAAVKELVKKFTGKTVRDEISEVPVKDINLYYTIYKESKKGEDGWLSFLAENPIEFIIEDFKKFYQTNKGQNKPR